MKKILIVSMFLLFSLTAQVEKAIEVPYIPYEIKMGKNFVEVQGHCLSCHSFGYIINQGPQSRKFWRGKVIKMIKHFKADMNKKQTDLVVDYLSNYYGNGK